MNYLKPIEVRALNALAARKQNGCSWWCTFLDDAHIMCNICQCIILYTTLRSHAMDHLKTIKSFL